MRATIEPKTEAAILNRNELRLMHARRDHCELVWRWANDPVVRAASFSSDPIPWEAHVEWFEEKLRDANCLILIAQDGLDALVGQVRFDLKNEFEAVINLSIGSNHRGRGFGSRLISSAVDRLFQSTAVQTVHAYIKTDNQASVLSFERAAFNKLSAE
ncbi:MAG: GNAT family N-acetyltransferase, partial [Blastocatellia bacterium]